MNDVAAPVPAERWAGRNPALLVAGRERRRADGRFSRRRQGGSTGRGAPRGEAARRGVLCPGGNGHEVLEKIEAGLVLRGTEVKSLRLGRANLNDSFGVIERGEAFLCNAHVSPYEFGNRENPDPVRKRKLLLHRREIAYLEGQVARKGLTLVPLRLYFSRGRAKVELAPARGKKSPDKRETVKRRIAEREIRRAIKGRSS